MDYGYNNENDAEKRRKEVLDELNNNNMKKEGLDSNIQSFGKTVKKSTVSFNKSNTTNDNTISDSTSNNSNNNESGNKIIGVFVIGIVAMLVIYFLPTIKEKVDEYNIKRNESKEEKKTVTNSNKKENAVPELKITDSRVQSIVYPVLHTDSGSKKTYLSNKKVTVKDISYNDLLYNSLNIRPNLIGDYKGGYSTKFCGSANQRVYIKASYIEDGVQDIFGKDVEFKNQNFVIPTNNANIGYTGSWVYDKINKNYIYLGDCNPKQSNYLYYDITVPYEATGEEKNVNAIITAKVGFAVVNKTNNAYVLYSDPEYTNKVQSGTLTTKNTTNELKEIVNKNQSNYKDFIYRFTKRRCPYSEYCFVSVEWK